MQKSTRRGAAWLCRASEGREVLAATLLDDGELGEGVLDVLAALLEVGAPLLDLAQEVLQLTAAAPGRVVEVDDRGDLVEGQAQALAAQHEGESGAVAPVEDPDRALPLRGDQADALVVAHRAGGHAELVRDLADGPGALPAAVGGGGGGSLRRACHGTGSCFTL